MTTSPDLGMPYIAGQQAQPEVTHNDALNMLIALQKGAIDRGLNTPPGSPTNGDVYIVGSAPTDAWAGKANKVAIYTTNVWTFVPGNDSDGANIAIGARHEGMRLWVQDEDALYVWSGSAWVVRTEKSGTAFPGSPASGDKFYRTDRSIEYYYDGTRWLSTQIFTSEIAAQDNLNPMSANAVYRGMNPAALFGYDIYVERFGVNIFNDAANTTTDYFTFRLFKTDGTSNTALGPGVLSGQGDTTSTWTTHTQTIGEVVASTIEQLAVVTTETGTANCYVTSLISYRLVG